MKNKYDFEGTLDDFEIWLKNWKPNEEKKKVKKKRYRGKNDLVV